MMTVAAAEKGTSGKNLAELTDPTAAIIGYKYSAAWAMVRLLKKLDEKAKCGNGDM
jgi:hypothetical protein